MEVTPLGTVQVVVPTFLNSTTQYSLDDRYARTFDALPTVWLQTVSPADAVTVAALAGGAWMARKRQMMAISGFFTG
jgi:hypothetical protein